MAGSILCDFIWRYGTDSKLAICFSACKFLKKEPMLSYSNYKALSGEALFHYLLGEDYSQKYRFIVFNGKFCSQKPQQCLGLGC